MLRAVLLLLTLAGCGSATQPRLAPKPITKKQILHRNQYAYTRLFGKKILCAKAYRENCGITLDDCTTGTRFECAVDVEIVDVNELFRRARAYKAQLDQNSI